MHYTFGTKKDLYRAVIEQLTADFMAHVQGATPGTGPFEEQVRALIRTLWESVTADGGRYALLNEFSALALRDPDLQQILANVQNESEQLAVSLLAELADAHGIKLALPAHQIGALCLAGFFGLADRQLALRADDELSAEHALDLVNLLADTVARLCRGESA